jgi:hypothetical protein
MPTTPGYGAAKVGGNGMLKDKQSSAAALYDGGWRAVDRDQLISEYELTAEEADSLCEELKKIDGKISKEDFLLMIKDWQADHAPEHDDLEIAEPEMGDKDWEAVAYDSKCTYLLTNNNGNIVINYLGTK